MGFIAGCLTRDRPVGPGLLGASSEVCRRLLHRAEAASPARVRSGRSDGLVMAGDPGLLRTSHGESRLTLVLDSRLTNAVALHTKLRAAGYAPLDSSDAAVVLAAWCAWGVGMVPHLRGAFAFALHDAETGVLTCARDRYGQRPFYYSVQTDVLVFASEMQGLLAWPDCDRIPDLDVTAHILTFGHAPLDRTSFVGIQRMPPGYLMVHQPNGHTVSKPWHSDGDSGDASTDPGAGTAAELRMRLDKSVQRALCESGSATTLGAGLAAAALDSSLDRLGVPQPLRPEDGPEADDGDDPIRVMTRLLWHQGEPIVHMSGLALHTALQAADGPALSTAGAAELLLGHGHYQAFAQRLAQFHEEGPAPAWWSGGFRSTPPFVRDLYHAVAGCMTEAERLDLCGPALMHTLLFSQPDALGHSLETATPTDAISRAARLDLRFRLPGLDLALLDAAAAATGAEVACPMLDEDFAAWCLSLPQATRLGAAHGHGSAYGLLHAATEPGIRRPAAAVESWPAPSSPLAARMVTAVAEILLDRRCLERGMYARVPLEQLVRRHREDGRRGWQALWGMLCIELWFNDFVDEVPRPPLDCRSLPFEWLGMASFEGLS